MGLWSVLTGGITSLVGKYFDNKKEQQSQTHTQKMQHIQGKQDWETFSIKQMASSLKDEWWTFWFSLPFVSIFCSPFVDLLVSDQPYQSGMLMNAALQGLQGLESTPTWYTYLLGLMIGASFGVRGVGEVVNKLRK